MMRRSDSAGCAPFMLASITRRTTAAVVSSLKAVAASSTLRAVSSAPPSCFEVSESSLAAPPLRPKPWPAALPKAGTPLPNGIAFMPGYLPSSCVKRGRDARVERCGAVLARLVECEHAARRLDVEAAVVAFEASQVAGGDPVILGAEEQQRHRGVPGEIQRLAQDQDHLAIAVEQRALDHIARQRAQQGDADRDLFSPGGSAE